MLLTDWFPHRPPIYNIRETYLYNAEEGPFFPSSLPLRPVAGKHTWPTFLDFKIASPFGVAAGPLLNSRWVALAANLGFDVLVYKTIRSREHPGHPLPNVLLVDVKSTLSEENIPKSATVHHASPSRIEELAITNSFGMPSRSPQYLLEDIPRAQAHLKDGQLLIVSVAGTQCEDCSFLHDFVDAAALARDAGARAIEINFSCPNVGANEGMLYMSPSKVLEFGSVLAKAMHPLPLIMKVGLFSSVEQMRDVLIAAAKAGIRAISGINGVSMRVVDQEGHPALGTQRFRAGICGGPIRNLALHFTEQAHTIIRKEKLELELIGVGGITRPEHFFHFLERGAKIAMAATGMMWDPYLALRTHEYFNKQHAVGT